MLAEDRNLQAASTLRVSVLKVHEATSFIVDSTHAKTTWVLFYEYSRVFHGTRLLKLVPPVFTSTARSYNRRTRFDRPCIA